MGPRDGQWFTLGVSWERHSENLKPRAPAGNCFQDAQLKVCLGRWKRQGGDGRRKAEGIAF